MMKCYIQNILHRLFFVNSSTVFQFTTFDNHPNNYKPATNSFAIKMHHKEQTAYIKK